MPELSRNAPLGQSVFLFLMPSTPYVFVVWAVPLANTMFLRQRSLSMTLFDNNRICTMGSNIAPNGVLFFGISGVLLDI
jgi:hypothetical protein